MAIAGWAETASLKAMALSSLLPSGLRSPALSCGAAQATGCGEERQGVAGPQRRVTRAISSMIAQTAAVSSLPRPCAMVAL